MASGPASGLTFSEALDYIKQGAHLTRQGWNGRGMWVTLQKGYPNGVPANENSAKAFRVPLGSNIVIRPYLVMRTVDGEFVPWVASQTDLLAEDWRVV